MSVGTVAVQGLGDVLLLRKVGAPLLTNNHSSTSGTLPANNAVPLQSSGHRMGWVKLLIISILLCAVRTE